MSEGKREPEPDLEDTILSQQGKEGLDLAEKLRQEAQTLEELEKAKRATGAVDLQPKSPAETIENRVDLDKTVSDEIEPALNEEVLEILGLKDKKDVSVSDIQDAIGDFSSNDSHKQEVMEKFLEELERQTPSNMGKSQEEKNQEAEEMGVKFIEKFFNLNDNSKKVPEGQIEDGNTKKEALLNKEKEAIKEFLTRVSTNAESIISQLKNKELKRELIEKYLSKEELKKIKGEESPQDVLDGLNEKIEKEKNEDRKKILIQEAAKLYEQINGDGLLEKAKKKAIEKLVEDKKIEHFENRKSLKDKLLPIEIEKLKEKDRKLVREKCWDYIVDYKTKKELCKEDGVTRDEDKFTEYIKNKIKEVGFNEKNYNLNIAENNLSEEAFNLRILQGYRFDDIRKRKLGDKFWDPVHWMENGVTISQEAEGGFNNDFYNYKDFETFKRESQELAMEREKRFATVALQNLNKRVARGRKYVGNEKSNQLLDLMKQSSVASRKNKAVDSGVSPTTVPVESNPVVSAPKEVTGESAPKGDAKEDNVGEKFKESKFKIGAMLSGRRVSEMQKFPNDVNKYREILSKYNQLDTELNNIEKFEDLERWSKKNNIEELSRQQELVDLKRVLKATKDVKEEPRESQGDRVVSGSRSKKEPLQAPVESKLDPKEKEVIDKVQEDFKNTEQRIGKSKVAKDIKKYWLDEIGEINGGIDKMVRQQKRGIKDWEGIKVQIEKDLLDLNRKITRVNKE